MTPAKTTLYINISTFYWRKRNKIIYKWKLPYLSSPGLLFTKRCHSKFADIVPLYDVQTYFGVCLLNGLLGLDCCWLLLSEMKKNHKKYLMFIFSPPNCLEAILLKYSRGCLCKILKSILGRELDFAWSLS